MFKYIFTICLILYEILVGVVFLFDIIKVDGN
jgi:hypothetical protein